MPWHMQTPLAEAKHVLAHANMSVTEVANEAYHEHACQHANIVAGLINNTLTIISLLHPDRAP